MSKAKKAKGWDLTIKFMGFFLVKGKIKSKMDGIDWDEQSIEKKRQLVHGLNQQFKSRTWKTILALVKAFPTLAFPDDVWEKIENADPVDLNQSIQDLIREKF